MDEWVAPRLPLRWTNPDLPPFVGRDGEVVALDSAWARARTGAGCAVFVLGEPGVGKSRLIGEACRRWHDDGAVVVVGTAVPEFGAAYEPLIEPLRVLGPLARTALGAENSDAVDIVVAALGQRSTVEAHPIGQGRLYESIVETVQAAASRRPLVLVLEDLHWADEGTLRILSRVIETTADAAILVLATARLTAPDRSEAFIQSLTRLTRLDRVGRVDLKALTAEDVVDYLVRRTGMTAEAADEPARLLGRMTGGNPFLLRETWRQAVEVTARGEIGVEMPETVHDLLRERILALDDSALTTLQHAAVMGQEVDLDELVLVCEAAPEVTLDAVDAAVASGLMEPPRLVRESYRFPHAIARQAVLAEIPATTLARMHARVGQALEQRAPNTPRLVQRLAHHFSSARVLGYGSQALRYLVHSAELAEARLAHEEAARLFEQAAGHTTDRVEADDLRLRAAHCWASTADYGRARALLEPIAREGSPSQRRRAAIEYEEVTWRPGLSGHDALELLRRAPQSDASQIERLHLQCATARAMVFTGALDEALLLADDALRGAREAGDREMIAIALRYSVNMSVRPSGLQRWLGQARELATVTVPGGDIYNAGANFRSVASYIVGDRGGLDAAQADLDNARRSAGVFWSYWVFCLQFSRSLCSGRLAQAAADAQLMKRADLEMRSDHEEGVFALQAYMLRRETRRVAQVAGLLTGEESTDTHWAPGLLALYTELELPTPARRVLRDTLVRATGRSRDSADWPAWLAFLAEAASWLEDREAAAWLRPALAEYAGVNLLAGWHAAPFGSADRYRADLDSLCGLGDPEQLFADALRMDEGMGAGLHAAYTRLAWARHLRRTAGADPRIAVLERAVQREAEREEWARVLWMLRRQQGHRSTRSDGLSEREVEVIRLLAEGLSNRDVARRLVISEHTAANHVRSILVKTDSANRTQAAAYARTHDLLT